MQASSLFSGIIKNKRFSAVYPWSSCCLYCLRQINMTYLPITMALLKKCNCSRISITDCKFSNYAGMEILFTEMSTGICIIVSVFTFGAIDFYVLLTENKKLIMVTINDFRALKIFLEKSRDRHNEIRVYQMMLSLLIGQIELHRGIGRKMSNELHKCDYCKKSGCKMICSGCCAVRYCSVQCQTKAWKANLHRCDRIKFEPSSINLDEILLQDDGGKDQIEDYIDDVRRNYQVIQKCKNGNTSTSK